MTGSESQETSALDRLVTSEFFPTLRKAVINEIAVNRYGYVKFHGRLDWEQFIAGVIKEMHLPPNWADVFHVREEFESHVRSIVKEYRRGEIDHLD
jgi:hypothetical protein